MRREFVLKVARGMRLLVGRALILKVMRLLEIILKVMGLECGLSS